MKQVYFTANNQQHVAMVETQGEFCTIAAADMFDDRNIKLLSINGKTFWQAPLLWLKLSKLAKQAAFEIFVEEF